MADILTTGAKEFMTAIEHKPCQDIGHMVAEYVLEATHNGWEGFSSRDKTGIGRLLKDLATFIDNYGEVKNLPIYTGTRFVTSDR